MTTHILQSVAVSPATGWAIAHRGHDFDDPDEDFWYAVLVGRNPGVFYKSHDISANMLRIPGASVVKCHTEEEAESEFQSAVNNGIAEKVNLTETSRYLSMSDLSSLPQGAVPENKTSSLRWYSVTVGRSPGVYNGPSGLAANLSGVSGAVSTKFSSRRDAMHHFVCALEAGYLDGFYAIRSMSGRKKNSPKKAAQKLPVGADGLNKHQRYYQKKKLRAQACFVA
ncbi:hypothetical protein HYPSUDRAFT_50880 [Hypholoma sublateritium FD-334 SS-4]|uniref:Ribonuclease H1 N-terminal domain-containing protein n=1 Tax=Hypholoma sublateritium (strain FD-334 SS-4) TaxID=945553 RepID=A0A0D2PFJ0_HYPSF|nr:hypothetical protein HYPSUDRAFT_50880 [Hypholoma sublateritium FD-334 SS-4]